MNGTLFLKHPEYLTVQDEQGALYHGADQEWFGLLWQRKAGCGPTTASHLVLYNRSGSPPIPKNDMVGLMETMWTHITHGIMGVHLVSQFTKGLKEYLDEQSLLYSITSLKVLKDRSRRVSFEQITAFIEQELQADQPVAFLNLSAGEVKNLDSWHWVTIVGLERRESKTYIHVYDGGTQWVIDLRLWYETTTRSGGFASLQRGENL
ncbi:MAG: hypothetical protein VB056_04680 [Sphaerochaeta associata]|uniref:hypothetical protein n=1 Tax=Sphaerochaeta associata TaxID=1129264 RepID=UPI002B1EB120|nr:hypothetical protein [Sphaerochaeta associata]MEA5028155.1 hypothetical protein [Sphaerochaeta associata]